MAAAPCLATRQLSTGAFPPAGRSAAVSPPLSSAASAGARVSACAPAVRADGNSTSSACCRRAVCASSMASAPFAAAAARCASMAPATAASSRPSRCRMPCCTSCSQRHRRCRYSRPCASTSGVNRPAHASSACAGHDTSCGHARSAACHRSASRPCSASATGRPGIPAGSAVTACRSRQACPWPSCALQSAAPSSTRASAPAASGSSTAPSAPSDPSSGTAPSVPSTPSTPPDGRRPAIGSPCLPASALGASPACTGACRGCTSCARKRASATSM